MRVLAVTSAVVLGSLFGTQAFSSNVESGLSVYSWADNYRQSESLQNRIAPPPGFHRKACVEGSFCEWLRQVPLKPEGTPVRYYNGGIKIHAQHYAVLDLDTGDRDLQQCADAVMRLKAEYHYGRKEYSDIHFNFTSGDKVSFDDWRRGRKPIVRGNKVSFSEPINTTDNSYKNFRKYMTIIFSYAGSLSLNQELQSVKVKNIQVGDVFIVGGSPGHAVMVMDVVENDAGAKMFLLAQSYMPAQDMHILKNPNHEGSGPWYSSDIEDILLTPEWQFSTENLKRFK